MKKNLLILTVLLFAYCTLQAQTNKILISGAGWPQVVLLDKQTNEIEWTYDLLPQDECEGIALTPEGNVLMSYKGGARLVTPKKETIWDYKLQEEGELFTAKQLKDGGFLLVHSGYPAKIIELNKKGKVRKTISYDTQIEDLHSQLRQITKSQKGTYLFPVLGKSEIVELDKNGKQIMRFVVEGNPFSIIELQNGNILVPCGDAHIAMEFDRKGRLMNTTTRDQYEGIKLNFVAEIVELKNGNRLICNWNGHAPKEDRNQPTLIEVDTNKQVVWALHEDNGVGRVSCVFAVENKKALANFAKRR